jgi:hypothetical protein
MKMNYDLLIENYTPQMQLIDALELLQHYETNSWEILDSWASQTTSEKIDVNFDQ